MEKIAEDNGKQQGTSGDGPSLGCIGQVPERTRRDNRMLSVLFLDQERSTAQLRTLAHIYQDPTYILRPSRVLWICGYGDRQMALVKVVLRVLKLPLLCALQYEDG